MASRCNFPTFSFTFTIPLPILSLPAIPAIPTLPTITFFCPLD